MIELLAAAWALSAGCLLWWIRCRIIQVAWQARVARMGIGTKVVVPPKLGPRMWVRGWGARFLRRWPRLAERVAGLAASAGLSRGDPDGSETGGLLAELMGWKLLGGGLGALLGLLLAGGVAGTAIWVLAFPLLFLTMLVGWQGLDLWLVRRATARRRAIERTLLTVADLLTLCLEAGMGIDRALRLICGQMRSPLGDELLAVLAEIDLGVPRRDAFTHLVERVAIEDVRVLATAIIQAEELSASLAGAMRVQSRALRVSQRHLLESEAQRAPVKMLIPMVVFVLPALFIVVLGPVVIQLMQALGTS